MQGIYIATDTREPYRQKAHAHSAQTNCVRKQYECKVSAHEHTQDYRTRSGIILLHLKFLISLFTHRVTTTANLPKD